MGLVKWIMQQGWRRAASEAGNKWFKVKGLSTVHYAADEERQPDRLCLTPTHDVTLGGCWCRAPRLFLLKKKSHLCQGAEFLFLSFIGLCLHGQCSSTGFAKFGSVSPGSGGQDARPVAKYFLAERSLKLASIENCRVRLMRLHTAEQTVAWASAHPNVTSGTRRQGRQWVCDCFCSLMAHI